MMVEAGGTETAWANYQSGSPKLDEDEIARGLEEVKPWIRQLCRLQRELVDEAEPKPPMEYVEQLDYTPEIYQAVVAAAGTRLADTQRIADKVDPPGGRGRRARRAGGRAAPPLRGRRP